MQYDSDPSLRETEARSFPTTLAQQRHWFIAQMYPNLPIHGKHRVLRLHGDWDAELLSAALSGIIGRHQILHTSFSGSKDGPIQTPQPLAEPCLEVWDLNRSANKLEHATEKVQHEIEQPFDLTKGPNFRVCLIVFGEKDYWLLLHTHEIVADRLSLDLILDELALGYGSSNPNLDLPKIESQYGDFALSQAQMRQSKRWRDGRAFWKRKLSDAPIFLELPTDRPRPAMFGFRGDMITFQISAGTTRRLEETGAASDHGLMEILLAAWNTLIFRYTRLTDLLLGLSSDKRDPQSDKHRIGCFSNALITRNDLSGNPRFCDLVSSIQAVVREARAHGDLPVEMLIQELQPNLILSHNPLFQVTFDFHERSSWDAGMVLNGGRIVPHTQTSAAMASFPVPPTFHHHGTDFDISLVLARCGDNLYGRIEYNTDIFDRQTAERMARHVVTILGGLSDHYAHRISQLPILPDEEQRALLDEWNETGLSFPGNVSLNRLIEAQVAGDPSARALLFADRVMTYKDFNKRANQLARHLLKLGVKPDQPIAIYMERGFDSLIATFAVFKAGGVYFPLDPIYPVHRLAHMLDIAAAPVMLTHDTLLEKLPRSCARVVNVNAAGAELSSYQDHNLDLDIDPLTGSYIVFTSGSTGAPKGILLNQRGLINFLTFWQHIFPLKTTDLTLYKTSCGFDPSTFELFWPLIADAGIAIAKPGGDKDNDYLVKLIRNHQVTTFFAVSAAMLLFLQEPGVEQCTSLKFAHTGGEPIPISVSKNFFSIFDAVLYNIYGPAEATCTAATGSCKPHPNARTVPFGKPVGNTQLYLLDPNFELVPIGVHAELFIGGTSVGRGYIKRPGLTAARFIPDPFGKLPGGRLYRTGDIVRYLSDSTLEFIGRNDTQVKIRGFRIELGEIEETLKKHPAIFDVAVVIHTNETGDKRLVAHLIAKGKNHPTRERLHAFLGDKLPDYMLPAYVLYHETFPRTHSGKLKRDALPAPPPERPGLKNDYLPPRTPLETKLASVWETVLDVKAVGIKDNFFELGGHSLSAIKLVKQIRDECKLDGFGLQYFLKVPTGELIAAYIQERYQIL